MDKIVDSHFHIWDFSLRATYPKTDASFDWPDSSLPVIHRNIQVITTKKKVLIGIPIVVLIMTYWHTLWCSHLHHHKHHQCHHLHHQYHHHHHVQATEAGEEMVKSGVEAAVFVQCLNRLKFPLFCLCCNCLSLFNVWTGYNCLSFCIFLNSLSLFIWFKKGNFNEKIPAALKRWPGWLHWPKSTNLSRE